MCALARFWSLATGARLATRCHLAGGHDAVEVLGSDARLDRQARQIATYSP